MLKLSYAGCPGPFRRISLLKRVAAGNR